MVVEPDPQEAGPWNFPWAPQDFPEGASWDFPRGLLAASPQTFQGVLKHSEGVAPPQTPQLEGVVPLQGEGSSSVPDLPEAVLIRVLNLEEVAACTSQTWEVGQAVLNFVLMPEDCSPSEAVPW